MALLLPSVASDMALMADDADDLGKVLQSVQLAAMDSVVCAAWVVLS